MKIAFWSCSRGRSGVTSNLACISILSSLGCPKKKAVLFENHQNIINIGRIQYRRNPREMVSEESTYVTGMGLENVLRHIEGAHGIDESIITRSSIAFIDNRLIYIPRSRMANQDFMEYELRQNVYSLMNTLESYYDTVYIDTAGSQPSTQSILQYADVVVVNLMQDPDILYHFFQNYSTIQKKAFYIIGNYDSSSLLRKIDIMRQYNIPEYQIGVMPYNMGFANAMVSGMLIPFLQRNSQNKKNSKEKDFMCAASECVNRLEVNAKRIYGQKGGGYYGA